MPGPRRGGREADEIGRTSEGVFPSELTSGLRRDNDNPLGK
jgi:hypothetical protein